MKVTAVLCALLAGSLSAAHAADIRVLVKENSVKDEGAIVLVKGFISKGDDTVFERKIAGINRAIVFLEGPGGSVQTAIDIGKIIRQYGFNTAAADRATCASSCALAWLGGIVRYAGDKTRIGFHSTAVSAFRKERSDFGNAMVRDYLERLGYSDAVFKYVTKASPASLTVPTPEDDQRYIGSLPLPRRQGD